MAESSGSSNTAIWVAVITVLGSLLTAVVVNADKWIARGSQPAAASVTASPPAATPTQPLVATPTPALTPVAATPSPAATPTAPAATPSEGTVNVAGVWRSDEGGRYDFELKGALFEATQTSLNGNFQMMIKGRVDGRDLEGTFETATGETGNCSMRVNAANTQINGNCVSDDGGWTFVLDR